MHVADTRPPPYALRERMLAALKRAVEIIEKHVADDALGTDWWGDPDVPGGTYTFNLLDEELHHMREAIREAEERAGLDSDEEMYAAGVEMRDALDVDGPWDGQHAVRVSDALEALRAALAKANGVSLSQTHTEGDTK